MTSRISRTIRFHNNTGKSRLFSTHTFCTCLHCFFSMFGHLDRICCKRGSSKTLSFGREFNYFECKGSRQRNPAYAAYKGWTWHCYHNAFGNQQGTRCARTRAQNVLLLLLCCFLFGLCCLWLGKGKYSDSNSNGIVVVTVIVIIIVLVIETVMLIVIGIGIVTVIVIVPVAVTVIETVYI